MVTASRPRSVRLRCFIGFAPFVKSGKGGDADRPRPSRRQFTHLTVAVRTSAQRGPSRRESVRRASIQAPSRDAASSRRTPPEVQHGRQDKYQWPVNRAHGLPRDAGAGDGGRCQPDPDDDQGHRSEKTPSHSRSPSPIRRTGLAGPATRRPGAPRLRVTSTDGLGTCATAPRPPRSPEGRRPPRRDAERS